MIGSATATNVTLASWIAKFHESFKKVSDNFEKRFERQKTVIEYFESVRIFDLTLRETSRRYIRKYTNLPFLSKNDESLHDEWSDYWNKPPI